MLPPEAVVGGTLAEGRTVAAASLYLTIDPQSLEVVATESRVEEVPIAANLRLSDLDTRLTEDAVVRGEVAGPHGADLLLLWRLARNLKVLRGAGDERTDKLDFTIRVVRGSPPGQGSDTRVSIEPRRRGTPVDTVVSELMIHVNNSWGNTGPTISAKQVGEVRAGSKAPQGAAH